MKTSYTKYKPSIQTFNETMKRSIFFLSLLCSMTVACTSKKEAKSTGDPIEDLVAYLDENPSLDSDTKTYQGGQVFTTIFEYNLAKPKGDPVKYIEEDGKKIPWDLTREVEIWDHTMNAIQEACSVARQCYHKESHARNRDTIYYAIAMEAMEGERIQGIDFTATYPNGVFHGERFKAGRALTFQAFGDDEWYSGDLEYITRSEGKPEQPFDVQFLVHNLNFLDKFIDSVKVYDVSYEYTKEEYQEAYDSPMNTSAIPMYYFLGDTIFQPRVTGKLYVVPKENAKKVGKWLQEHIMGDYVKAQPHTKFSVMFQEGKGWNTILNGKGPEYNTHLRAIQDRDGRYNILFLEKVQGCYLIPDNWSHILSVKDHKVEYVPGYKPN